MSTESAGRPVETLTLRARLSRAQRWAGDRPLAVLLLLLVVLMLATNVVSPGFLLPGNFSTSLLSAGPLGMLAAGQTVVLLTGGIDLSITVNATVSAFLLAQLGADHPVPAVFAALGLGLLIGLVNGIGIGPFGVSPLIMTLGMSGILAGMLTIWSANSSGTQTVPDFILQAGSGKVLHYVPIDVLIWAGVTILLMTALRGSGFGRVVYAVGDNPEATRLAGIRNWQVLIAVYMLCGLLSAAAGILLAGYTGAVDQQLASPYLLQSVAAVVIGGTSILGGSGGYGGSIVGVVILTVLGSLLVLLTVPEAVRQVLYGVIVLGLAWVYTRAAGEG